MPQKSQIIDENFDDLPISFYVDFMAFFGVVVQQLFELQRIFVLLIFVRFCLLDENSNVIDAHGSRSKKPQHSQNKGPIRLQLVC